MLPNKTAHGMKIIMVRYLNLLKKKKPTSKDFVCEICGKAYANKHFLARHKQTHVGIKPFQRTICAKSFLFKSALKEHLRMHTGEKTIHMPTLWCVL